MLSKLDKKTIKDPEKTLSKIKKIKFFPKSSYMHILIQLRNWIAKLKPMKPAEPVIRICIMKDISIF